MADKCIFEYVGLAGATSYQVEVQPAIDIIPKRKQHLHELSGGLDKLYVKGNKFHIKLAWEGERLFEAAQSRELFTIYNAITGITFYPYPETAPTVSFAVAWYDEEYPFHWVDGHPKVGFNGTMNLTGTIMFDTPPEEWIVE